MPGKHAMPREKKPFGLTQKVAYSVIAAPLLLLSIPAAHALTAEPEAAKVTVEEQVEVTPEYVAQKALTVPGEQEDVVAGTFFSADTLITAEKAPEPPPPPPAPEPEPEPEPVAEEPVVEEPAEEAAESVEEAPESESEAVEAPESAGDGSAPSEGYAASSDSVSPYSGEDISAARSAIIEEAKKHIGVPYRWGGTTPSGFDCSGYTSWVYRHAVGVTIPRTSGAQATAGERISKSEALPGDLIYMPGHIGIYAGNGMMYNAPSSGKTVSLAKIWTSNYSVVRVL